MQKSQNTLTSQVRTYTPARLHTGKEWYISFTAYDPALQERRRKRIKINSIKKISDRRAYAADMIENINIKLRKGWNPWVEQLSALSYKMFDESLQDYNRYITKLTEADIIREKTLKGYLSMGKAFKEWNEKQPKPINYCYQITQGLLSDYLDYLWIDRNLSVVTRNNHLVWIRNFCNFLTEKDYISEDPSAALKNIGKKKIKKNRTVIEPSDMQELKRYCIENNKHFLLACYILYYCFIRPKEMSDIRLSHISISKGTIYIPEENSKNRKEGIVTLPNQVVELMAELNIFANPGSYYLFSHKMKPGREHNSSKQFTDYWNYHVKKSLRFPDRYKFYSLKDTGITDLIISNTDLVSVRNQARHHSLTMTDIYTPQNEDRANEIIRNRRADF